MIVLESNQNHATVHDTEVCNALPAAMGMGGGYIPMIVTYRKTAHPRESGGFQGYEETIVNDTLNVYDNTETRTPTLIVQKSKNETLVFPEGQITCPNNGPNPQWNGPVYALDRDAWRNVVIIKEE